MKNLGHQQIILEGIKIQFENGKNATELMNEMEILFGIPGLNDEEYNTNNPKVIELYREIANSRKI